MKINLRHLISIVPLITLCSLLFVAVLIGNTLAAVSRALLYFDRTDAPRWVLKWLAWIDEGE